MRRYFYILALVGFGAADAAMAFDASDIPHISDSTRRKIEKDYKRSNAKDTYTVAVSTNGGWGAVGGGRLTEGDLVRGALQKCEHITKSRCGIAILKGESVAFREYPPQIRYLAEFDVKAVPFIRKDTRERLAKDYADQGSHKALVITRNGGYGFSYDEASADAAVEKAMGYCNKNGKRNCFVYDVDGRVLFTRETDIFSLQTEKNW